jgi:hypothetical protein
MPFRIKESTANGLERAISYLCSPKNIGSENAEAGKNLLKSLTETWGPVINSYPVWHPLVAAGNPDLLSPATSPRERCGYKDIDHSVYFQNAFISCPYGGAERLIESVRKIRFPEYVHVECEALDAVLYHPNATAVLVTCDWQYGSEPDGTISKRYAIGAMLDRELPCWQNAQKPETWQTMRPYFLGQPCGSKSSLFVNHDTGQAMKKIWESIIQAGVFGTTNKVEVF